MSRSAGSRIEGGAVLRRPVKDFAAALKGLGIVLLVASLSLPAAGCPPAESGDRALAPRVLIETELGDIVVELDARRAPLSTANFLRYIDEGRYASASFYRTVRMDNQPRNEVKIEVIQGGLGYAASGHRLPPIRHETTRDTGLRHEDGTLSMARLEPGSASSEIFICIGDQPELDFGGRRNPDGQGFAAFGRVVEGMDVVRRIHGQPADGQMLDPPVEFVGARRLGVY